MRLKRFMQRLISTESFQLRRVEVEILPRLTLAAILIGIGVAFVIFVFRQLIDYGSVWLFGVNYDAFEAISAWWLCLLPIIGATLVGCLGLLLRVDGRHVGIVHVMYVIHNKRLRLPFRSSAMQFIGGSIALLFGSSGGWIGPSAHLGAATASTVTELLPRTVKSEEERNLLWACGMAAAIAACLSTPIAAVILVVEVVLLRFSLTSLIPVLFAAFIAMIITQSIYGDHAVLVVPEIPAVAAADLLFLVPMGVFIGLIAVLFNFSVELAANVQGIHFFWRAIAVGLLTGLVAYFVPQLLGTGFDTFNLAVNDSLELGIGLVAALVALKFLLTSFTVGLGLPVGIIGPTLVMGGLFGWLTAELATIVFPATEISHLGSYVLLGACAMMAAVFNAPLAAIIVVVELSGSVEVILPAMLVIVIANFVTAPLYGRRGIFEGRMEAISSWRLPHFKRETRRIL